MTQADEHARKETERLAQELLELVGSCWKTQAVYVAAELRIADFLIERSRTSEELAALTETNPTALRQLLRALTTIGICRELDDGSFAVTPLGFMLATEAPNSLRSWSIWWGSQLWRIWGQLHYSVKTGHSARKLLQGSDGFAHLERDPALAEVFHRGAAENSRLAASGIVQAYDFSVFQRIVDVGGGSGELLAGILQTAPAAKGVLFDLPYAIEQGKDRLEKLGLAARCEFAIGDFFDSIPSGGDLYILKSVLHDWHDERCGSILKNCRRAMALQGRLLLIEEMLPDHMNESLIHQSLARGDLTMLLAHAAHERTAPQLRGLLETAGFSLLRVIPAGGTFSLIEASPASY
jgi:SAM-dependent methyltransferase